MRKYILVVTLFTIFIHSISFATEQKEIENYKVRTEQAVQEKNVQNEVENYIITVEPNLKDGSLDITYEIALKIQSEVSIGGISLTIPNLQYDKIEPLTDNIEQILEQEKNNIFIKFNKEYYNGQKLDIKCYIHQINAYKISKSECIYEFMPAYFKYAKVNNMQIK